MIKELEEEIREYLANRPELTPERLKQRKEFAEKMKAHMNKETIRKEHSDD